MTYRFTPAVRTHVPLLISLAGTTGSGKTLSALKVARGLACGDDSKIAFIDTEAGRALHYAPAKGQVPGPVTFGFERVDMSPPFSPESYAEAIAQADADGFSVVVIDSASHLWEGDGGVKDMHAGILDELVEQARKNHNGNWAFDEGKTRERLSVGAWNKPKQSLKRFMSKLLQTRAHVVLCLRADEKMRMEKAKDDRGRERTVITQARDLPPAERWSPICEKRLPYEMTLSFILTPDRPGFPLPIKLQEQHKAAVPLDRPLSEDTGRLLAEWARGGSPAPSAGRSEGQSGATPDQAEADRWLEEAREAADRGTAPFRATWKRIPEICRPAVQAEMEALKERCAKADAEASEMAADGVG